MAPIEKAKEICKCIMFHYRGTYITFETVKKCGLIHIKDKLTELNKLPSRDLSDLQYWGEVEYELNKLKEL